MQKLETTDSILRPLLNKSISTTTRCTKSSTNSPTSKSLNTRHLPSRSIATSLPQTLSHFTNSNKKLHRRINSNKLRPQSSRILFSPSFRTMFTISPIVNATNVRSGPRIGTVFMNSPRQIKTPYFVIGSARGSTPHLTPDMIDTLPEYKSMQISIGEVNSLLPALQIYKDTLNTPKPYHSMLCLRPDQSIIVSLRNPSTDLQYYAGRFPASKEQLESEAQFPYTLSGKLATTRSDNGVIRLSAVEFLHKTLLLEPDMIVLGGQNSDVAETKSRAEKTMRRNLEWCDEVFSCMESASTLDKIHYTIDDYENFASGKDDLGKTFHRPMIIAPIEGGSHPDKRTRNGGVMSRKGTSDWIHMDEPKWESFMTAEEEKNATPDEVTQKKAQFTEQRRIYQDKITNEGYSVSVFPDGFHFGGLGTAIDSNQRVSMIKSSLEYINKNEEKMTNLEQLSKNGKKQPFSRFRMTTTTGEPNEILDMVLNGLDYFAVTYPQTLTEEGLAMKLPYKMTDLMQIIEAEKELSQLDNETSNQDTTARMMRKLHSYNIMNLRDQAFIEDNLPLDENCACYACQHHSRSYINHLLNTQEMLAEVLLMLHNMHQFSQFFTTLQDLIELHHLELEEHYKTQPFSQTILVQTKIGGFTSPIETSLTKWVDMMSDIIVPHGDILRRNSRRRYVHQDTSQQHGSGAPSGPVPIDTVPIDLVE